MLQCSADDISLTRDDFGRPVSAEPPGYTGWPPGARLCLALGDDAGRRLLALARDVPVALSVHTVPRGPVSELLLPFTALEREFVRRAPAERRARRLARLWTRKEAALRLTGRGGLATADEIDALGGAREADGTVALPVSVTRSGGSAYGGGAHGGTAHGGLAYVRELPAGPGRVACAATAAPVPGVRLWGPSALDSRPVPGS
ncbi:4'-phosphopantetheinyl transferase superfamily protein [Streptomyces albospinus]|uniref:4'-phosphopantetheinyl transferase superfamily protein n=1 Tax=Streptomyces albospinus TaxID=285515 RepID=UPI0016700A13|nr:4'-phosphopantetheinyl transferase superfamily protein [Streptomyces albospinus]